MGFVDLPGLLLVLIGAANIGLIGLLDVNLIAHVAGQYTKLIEILVGLAAAWQFYRQRWF